MAVASASGVRAARVVLEGVGKQFAAGAPVLADLSLTAEPGDFIALIGPSGCGKTTVLRLLAGLTSPSSGTLAIDGQAPTASRARLSYIFQEPTLLPWLTTLKNVALPMRLRGARTEAQRAAAEEVLQHVGLAHAAQLYPRQLSGGMKMRASLARALTLQPGLILLDEPFAALDEMTRNRLNEDLLRLRETAPFTAFFVTHSVAEAVFLSRRVLIMGAQPGHLAEEIAVPFPYPRTAALRATLEYQQVISHVTTALHGVLPPAAPEVRR